MTRKQFVKMQQDGAVRDLTTLVLSCRRRILRAANLLQMQSAAIEELRKLWWSERLDVRTLLPAWHSVCERYVRERWSDQLPLFDDPDLDPATKWSMFVHWQMLPALVREDEVARNVLRAVGWLPCKDRGNAVKALQLYLAEMPLPDSAPLWAPEEEDDA